MNPHEIFDSVMVKSLEHRIDFNFLYPAVLCVAEKLTCNDDDLFRAYFAREMERLAGGPPSDRRIVVDGEAELFESNTLNIKDVAFYLKPDQPVVSLHLDIFEKLIDAVIDARARFQGQSGSKEIHTIVRTLCSDIIQKLHNRRAILN